ncbi:MAG: hypothetical protein ABIO91_03850 [Pyrinomonadaceae bacterium]
MKRAITSGLLLMVGLIAASCGPNQRILESANGGNVNSEPAAIHSDASPTPAGFEQDLNAMRTADFKFIIVFRRKDGQVLDAADKELIARNASQANRRRLADEGRAVIIGSNFPFVTGAFQDLNERFKMENYSKPDSGPIYSNTRTNQ